MKIPVQLLAILILLIFSAAVSAQNHVIWSGGIGADERAQAPQGGTRLVFAMDTGAYLSLVQVSITDAEGQELVNTRTDGPWLILDLPDGEYRVSATREAGSSVSNTFTVGGSQREFIITFRD